MTYQVVQESLAQKAGVFLHIAKICDRRIRGVEAVFGDQLAGAVAYLESWQTNDAAAFESLESDIWVPTTCQDILRLRDGASSWGNPSMNAVRVAMETEIENLRLIQKGAGDISAAKKFALAVTKLALSYMGRSEPFGLAA